MGLTAIMAMPATAAKLEATVSVVPAAEQKWQLCGVFFEDYMRLTIRDGQGNVSTHDYCSSSGGYTSAEVLTDHAGAAFVLLRYEEGRGTSPVTQYLAVYKVASSLIEYLRTPIMSASGPTTQWRYTYTAAPLPRAGIRIVLTMEQPARGGGEFTPSEAVRIIDIDAGDST
jgi:hypothetical protein